VNEEKREKLKRIFFASLLIENTTMEKWCKEKGIKYKSLQRWLYKGFPKGKNRKTIKGKQALKEIIATIDKVGLSDKIDPMWRSYYDFKS
jgi:hypothetical protein